ELHVPPRLVANVFDVAARTTVFMVDKPAVIADLQDGAPVRFEPVDRSRFDLVVDATGEARAYAPPLSRDIKARVVQWRLRLGEPAPLTFVPTRSVPGYGWVMPLSADGMEAHVGVGCLARTTIPARVLAREVLSSVDTRSISCACGSRIRLSGPDFGQI